MCFEPEADDQLAEIEVLGHQQYLPRKGFGKNNLIWSAGAEIDCPLDIPTIQPE